MDTNELSWDGRIIYSKEAFEKLADALCLEFQKIHKQEYDDTIADVEKFLKLDQEGMEAHYV